MSLRTLPIYVIKTFDTQCCADYDRARRFAKPLLAPDCTRQRSDNWQLHAPLGGHARTLFHRAIVYVRRHLLASLYVYRIRMSCKTRGTTTPRRARSHVVDIAIEYEIIFISHYLHTAHPPSRLPSFPFLPFAERS